MSGKLENGFFSDVLKGTLCAVIITLFGVLIFALVVKFALLGSAVIKAVNQFIKILSVFLGCSFFLRGRMGLVRGALIGVISTVIVYALFSLFGGEIFFSYKLLIDIIFSLVIGGVSGIIAVNLKAKNA